MAISMLQLTHFSHAYTSGRWLRRDQLERNARYVKFDFNALTRRIIELCPGATAITNYYKKEGGFNRVFVFITDNRRRLVAKLPFPIAGPTSTIDLVQTHPPRLVLAHQKD